MDQKSLKNLQNQTTKNETDTSEVEGAHQPKPTQTDHLNKKLLSSFLDRLNSGAGAVPVVVREAEAADQQQDDTLGVDVDGVSASGGPEDDFS